MCGGGLFWVRGGVLAPVLTPCLVPQLNTVVLTKGPSGLGLGIAGAKRTADQRLLLGIFVSKVSASRQRGGRWSGFGALTRRAAAAPLHVMQLVPGAAAAEQGYLREGDELLEVNGRSLIGESRERWAAMALDSVPQQRRVWETQESPPPFLQCDRVLEAGAAPRDGESACGAGTMGHWAGAIRLPATHGPVACSQGGDRHANGRVDDRSLVNRLWTDFSK